MGNGSSSEEQTIIEEEQAGVDMQALNNKLKLMSDSLEKTRGTEGSSTEVSGGRSIMRYSRIFVSKAENLNPNISDAIDAFFAAADSGIDNKEAAANHSAVHGAKKLVDSAVTQLTRNRSSQTSEMKSFVTVFMNNAFCRVDYYIYQQFIDAGGIGFSPDNINTTTKVARILVCDVAVIPSDMLTSEEMTFLLSASLHIPSGKFQDLLVMSANLAQVTMLNSIIKATIEKLKNGGAIGDGEGLDKVVSIMTKIAEANNQVQAAFSRINFNLDSPEGLIMHKNDASDPSEHSEEVESPTKTKWALVEHLVFGFFRRALFADRQDWQGGENVLVQLQPLILVSYCQM